MKLRSRLLVYGAVVPTLLLVAGMGSVGLMFERALVAEHDRALMSQAAVEAVSLFDRAAAPHLHLADSPLDERLQGLAPNGALYGPDGARVIEYPIGADVPERLVPATVPRASVLHTEVRAGTAFRVLKVRVEDPQGRPYCLWLAASLTQHEREMATYWQISAAIVLAAGSIALGLQWINARGLVHRIDNLGIQMRALKAGRLDARPAADPVADEIGALRDAIAETSSRLESARKTQDRLVADAAHELRTPLASIRAAIDVTLRRPRSGEVLAECLGDVRTEVERLSSLATRLLDLAALRAAPMQRAPGDLVRVLLEAVDAARAAAEPKRIVVALEAPADAHGLFASSAVRQALDNLLANAIAFSPEGSRIDVGLAARQGAWCVDVRDQGPGVPPAEREAVFEPFHRASHGSRGKGLGLAIVRDIAALHEGWVRIEDGDGTGSWFRLCLGPVLPAAPA